MKKLYSLWDVYRFPLITLFIAILLMGFGDFFQNSSITPFINIQNESFQTFCDILKYTGVFWIRLFPILLLVQKLAKRYQDSVPVYTGILAYLAFNIITMYTAQTGLPEYCYMSVMGMSLSTGAAGTLNTITKYPLFTGTVGVILVSRVTEWQYRRSRRRFEYGALGFISNDAWAMIGALAWTSLMALGFSFVWPYVILGVQDVLNYIASDIYNPMNMFMYGLSEQALGILDLQDLIHQPFWFGELGGSWMDSFGQTYAGDINIWTALTSLNVGTRGSGRFITPYYIMNCFAIPALILAAHRMTTDQLVRRRQRGMMILGIVVSILFGITWPADIFLAITAPGLYFIYILGFSLLYAVLPEFSIIVGYSYSGTISTAMPGTFISYIPYITNPDYFSTSLRMLAAGAVYAAAFYYLTKFYYRHLSADFLDGRKNAEFNLAVANAMGGLDNIRLINSTIFSVTVRLYDPSKLDTKALREAGAYRVTQTRAGISVDFGSRSPNIREGISRQIRKAAEKKEEAPQSQG